MCPPSLCAKAPGANPSVLAAAIITDAANSGGLCGLCSMPPTAASIGSHRASGPTLTTIDFHARTARSSSSPMKVNSTAAHSRRSPADAALLAPSASSVVNAAGVGPLSATTADFTAFDTQAAALRAAGVRIFKNASGTDAVPSTDFEPGILRRQSRTAPRPS